jgi:thiamine pyridinylase
MHYGRFVITLLIFQFVTMETKSYAKVMDKSAITVLKVAPFPYLPDSVGDQYKSLFQFITDQFEMAYPNIRLELRPLNTSDGFYVMPTLAQWLASDGSGYDVVEIDTVLLGDLVNVGLIAPQFSLPDNHSDWHPATVTSVQFNQALYAYPHLMCATFLFTRDEQAAKATTIDQLTYVLGSTPTTNYRLVGNLDSSWVLPGRLIHSYQDSSDPRSNVAAFALHRHESSSFELVHKLARLCDRINGENHCLDGTFDIDPDMPALLFARKQADAMFAYSEQLFIILKNGASDDYDNIKMTPLPAGLLHNQPLFSTDAYVFRKNMSEDVLNAARSFVDFMATPRMQAAVVGSGDSPFPNTIPRYLLPISQNAYNEPLLANNRFYQDFFRNLTGFSLPTVGFFNTRKEIQAALLKYIKSL